MFFYLKGTAAEKHESFFVLDISGVGFKIFTSKATLNCIKAGQETTVYTYTYVKEDALDIYGFVSLDELSFFEKLITVSGVGPRLALGILSTFHAKEIIVSILSNDSKKLTSAPGVGPKLAQRIILELKDKVDVDKVDLMSDCDVNSCSINPEAINALVALGYGEGEANRAVSSVDKGLSLEDTIKKALVFLAK